MGYKNVCFSCRKAYNFESFLSQSTKCPECSEKMVKLHHLFKPPKQADKKKWDVVKYLVDHGFTYRRVWISLDFGCFNYGKLPEKMSEAKEFVNKYHKKG